MEVTTLLFDEGGKHNTGAALERAKQRALELGIKQVVVASTHGYTAKLAHETLAPEGIGVIAVTICHGFESRGWAMAAETKTELRERGIVVHSGVHPLGSALGASYTAQYGGPSLQEIVRDTLYRFSQGMKVAVEVMLMAADAGLLDMEQEVISLGGSGEGADTVLVCKPAYPRTFHSLEIREVLAKPRIL